MFEIYKSDFDISYFIITTITVLVVVTLIDFIYGIYLKRKDRDED